MPRSIGIAAVLTIVAVTGAATQGGRDVEPHPAIDAILDAFTSHDLVFLGEGHGSIRQHEFRVSLVRDPRFAAVVNDIPWSSATADSSY